MPAPPAFPLSISLGNRRSLLLCYVLLVFSQSARTQRRHLRVVCLPSRFEARRGRGLLLPSSEANRGGRPVLGSNDLRARPALVELTREARMERTRGRHLDSLSFTLRALLRAALPSSSPPALGGVLLLFAKPTKWHMLARCGGARVAMPTLLINKVCLRSHSNNISHPLASRAYPSTRTQQSDVPCERALSIPSLGGAE